MSDNDTAEQLRQLRADLDRLEAQRREHAAPPPAPGTTASAAEPVQELPQELAAWLQQDGDIDAEAIIARLKAGTADWLDGLNDDLKDTKPSTILLLFGLGVVVGRLTA